MGNDSHGLRGLHEIPALLEIIIKKEEKKEDNVGNKNVGNKNEGTHKTVATTPPMGADSLFGKQCTAP